MEAEAKLEREAEEGRRIMAKVGAYFAETGADLAVMTLGSDEVSGPESYDGELPYLPESERGNPQPQYGKVEWPCPSAEAIEDMAEACADDTRAYLASIEARLK